MIDYLKNTECGKLHNETCSKTDASDAATHCTTTATTITSTTFDDSSSTIGSTDYSPSFCISHEDWHDLEWLWKCAYGQHQLILQKSQYITVEPGYNKLCYNEVPGIQGHFAGPNSLYLIVF